MKHLKQITDSFWYFILSNRSGCFLKNAVPFKTYCINLRHLYYSNIHITTSPLFLKNLTEILTSQKVICTFQFLRSIKFCACQVARKLMLQEFNNNLIQLFMKGELMKINFTNLQQNQVICG